MIDQPTITDGVVWLTPLTHADGAALGEFNLDDDHRRWFDQPPVDPDPAARRRHGEEVVERWQHGWTTGEELTFAVRLAADGEAIGMAELQPGPEGRADISYSIVPAHRRNGYAARAVRLLSDVGLGELGFRWIELRCDAENVVLGANGRARRVHLRADRPGRRVVRARRGLGRRPSRRAGVSTAPDSIDGLGSPR